jgi:hypothetical protein
VKRYFLRWGRGMASPCLYRRVSLEKLIFLLVWVSLLFGQFTSALAHGGGTLQIMNAPIADAYRVSVWSAPATIRAHDDIHITVGVADLVAGAPVLDTAVQVEIYQAATGNLITSAAATTEQSVNRLFYEADMAGLPQGDYDVVVTVTGEAGGGAVDFALEIRPYLNLPLIVGVGFVVVLFLAGGLFAFRRSQPPTAAPKRRPRPLKTEHRTLNTEH